MDKVRNILDRLDIKVNYIGENYVACPTEYRGGDNPVGLLCYEGNLWDQVAAKRMTWPEFVALYKKISLKDAEKWLAGMEVESGAEEEKVERIEQPKYLNETDYQDLVKSYDFFLRRGISKEVLDEYNCGLAQSGAMYGRLVFKIRDERGKLIGAAGRDALNRNSVPKWKNKGNKSKWVYPTLPKNIEAIQKTRQMVVVESVGDMLALNQRKIWNVLVNFGLSLSPARLSYILKCNPDKIFVGLNNDEGKRENWGQRAAGKVEAKLKNFFSSEKIVSAPPTSGDFGEMNDESIDEWAEKYGVIKL